MHGRRSRRTRTASRSLRARKSQSTTTRTSAWSAGSHASTTSTARTAHGRAAARRRQRRSAARPSAHRCAFCCAVPPLVWSICCGRVGAGGHVSWQVGFTGPQAVMIESRQRAMHVWHAYVCRGCKRVQRWPSHLFILLVHCATDRLLCRNVGKLCTFTHAHVKPA